jgi:hypothetical protein
LFHLNRIYRLRLFGVLRERVPGLWLQKYLYIGISVVFLSLAASGCTSLNDFLNPQPPTLVPTLEIVLPPTQDSQASLPLPTPVPPQATEQIATVTQTGTPAATATRTRRPTITRTPTAGPSPTVTRTPTFTRTVTRTPTITYTPTPPLPGLYILRPGLLSRVVSPIQSEMHVITGAEGLVDVELVGEDGRVISRRTLEYAGPNMRYWAAPELPFEIASAAETARLQISTRDEFGRISRLFSTDLVLLQFGRSEINPAAVDQEPYLIRQPDEEAIIGGGVLVVEALAHPVNDSPLIIELIDENNTVIVTKQVIVPEPTGELSHTPFRVEIPYRVMRPVPVRLVLRQEGSRIPGTVALISQVLTISP